MILPPGCNSRRGPRETITKLDGTWLFREKNRVWRGNSEREPANTLTIIVDGGVRTQRLTDLGWVDLP